MKPKKLLLKLMNAVEELGIKPENSKWGRADYGSYVGGDKAKKLYDTMVEIKGQLGSIHMAKPKTPKEPLSPQEFYAIPITSKQHVLALTYMATCTLKGFTKKPLFPLLRYFANKVCPTQYQVFFDYMYSISQPTEVSLYDLYALSQQHQLSLRLQSNKPEESIEPYESLRDCLGKL